MKGIVKWTDDDDDADDVHLLAKGFFFSIHKKNCFSFNKSFIQN